MKVNDIINYYQKLMEADSPDKECPICKRKYGNSTWSISREDNETEICCVCGLLEALKSYGEYLQKGEIIHG